MSTRASSTPASAGALTQQWHALFDAHPELEGLRSDEYSSCGDVFCCPPSSFDTQHFSALSQARSLLFRAGVRAAGPGFVLRRDLLES